MTFIKASSIALGLAGAYALGVLTGPHLTESTLNEAAVPVVQASQTSATADAPAPRAARVPARQLVKDPFEAPLPASTPSVKQHAKSVLNAGTNVEIASEGFRDAELFVSTAYAARNTEIPFALLKHRVVTEGQTLSEAIRMSKPELDAVVEMDRARTKARAVIARLGN